MQPAFEVSWRAIEPHWKVAGRDGEELGEVYAVVGDVDKDIFDGLALTRVGGPSALHAVVDKPRYIGYEQVDGIEPGLVRLRITREQFDDLPVHEAHESLRILPDGGGTGGPTVAGGDPGAGGTGEGGDSGRRPDDAAGDRKQ